MRERWSVMVTLRLMVCGVVACATCALWAANGTWSAAGGGNWSDTANWAAATPATGSTYTATFTTGTGTVNNDLTDLALKGVQLSGSGFTLAGNTLTLDSAGFIAVLGGSHAVSLPLVLQGATTLTVASAQTLAVNGAVSGNGGLTIYGGRAVLGNAANSYTGATILVTGILEVASVAALGSSSVDPGNLVLGDGTFRYTGSSETLSRGFTLAPTNFGNRALVIDVTNAATTLTVAGKVATPNGAFIKTGDGTLAFTYPGYQEIGKSRLSNGESGVITYDANGVADTNSYPTFVVDKGRVILGAAGQTNVIVASSGWVGSRTLASPRLDIIGGVTRFTGGYFTIGRGTGTTASPQRPTMSISGGSYVTIEGSGLVLDNANGQGNHRCSPTLAITNATLRVFNDCFLSEDGNATSTVTVANGGLFQSDSSSPVGGMKLSANTGAKTDVTFDTGSTGLVYQARLARGSSLTVIGNSVFAMDTTPTNAYQTDLNVGRVLFNGGKLAQRTTSLVSDWFVSLTNILVGANNMTLDVASQAWLDAPTRADPSNLGGKLIKSGNGTLVIRPTGLNVQVNAGRMAYAVEAPQVTNALNSTVVTFGGGTSVELSANGAANGVTLGLSGATLNLTPHSLVSNPDLWRYNDRAMRRGDGILQLTPEMGTAGALANQRGSAFLQRKQSVSGPWTATFSYICWATGATPADGFAFVLQNDPRGLGAIGSYGANLGYADTTANKITNSIAVGINIDGHQIRFGRQGSLVDTRALPTALPKLAATPVKTKFTVSYDGSGLMTVMIDRPGSISYGYTWQVNLAAEVGASDAYLGFTAGTGSRYGQHSITDFLFDNGTAAPPSYCRYGGRITLGGGETLTTFGNPSTQQRGFVVGSLAYADQSVIQADASAAPSAPPAPTLADQGMWKLNQNAHWLAPGRLATSTNEYSQAGGTAFTTNVYPVTVSWNAHFGFDMGLKTDPPADYINFIIQNLSTANTSHTPNPGLAIQWRYYLNGVTTTHLFMYTNGIQVLATTNIAPVSLRYGGHADMSVAYNATTRALTVTTSQVGGTNVTVFSGVDLLTAIGSKQAYLGFAGATGGLYAENIVSDFSFSAAAVAAASGGTGYLAFDKLSGSGTLIKRGTAALGLMGDMDLPTSNTAVRLEQGGLVLRKNNLEPLSVTGARSDWAFTPEGKWGDDGTLQFCTYVQNSTGTATTSRRVRVKEPWTVSYGFKSSANADAYSFFLHNDPRGPGAVGGATTGAGYNGITPSIGLRWCFYPGHAAAVSNKVTIGRAGNWDEGKNVSYLPVVLMNGLTGCTIKYDPVAATLTTVLTQGVFGVTNVFTGVNIPTDVGSDYAYLGFGGGCGGATAEMRVRDFTMTYDTPLTDTLPNQTYLASLILPAASTNTVTLDTSIANGSFKIASAAVGSGASFGLGAAVQPGTLAVGSVTQSGDASYPVAAGCTLVASNVVGGATLTKSGAGTLALAGSVATYTGATRLTAGTLSLPAALMPSATDLYVTSGAALNLAFAGRQYVHMLIVNGVMMHGGMYTSANASWITGPGTLVVTYPPVGTTITVK